MEKYFTLRLKIIILPVIAAIMLIIILFSGRSFISQNNNFMEMTSTKFLPSWELGIELQNSIAGISHILRKAADEKSESNIRAAESLRDVFFTNIKTAVTEYQVNVDDFKNIENGFSAYFTAARELTLEQIRRGNNSDLQQTVVKVESQYDDLDVMIKSKIKSDRARLIQKLETTSDKGRNMMILLTLVVLIFIIFIGVSSIYNYRSLSRPIKMMADIASRVSEGDLTVDVPVYACNDEIGMLMKMFSKMVSTLKGLTGEIKSSANGLAAAAGQISTSVAQISSAATETASAASQTSTTVEEVRMTALDSNRKAKDVSASALKSVEISLDGEHTVQDAIKGMEHIDKQMESIAESIMKLSEHGQAIGDIIEVVEDVAEQSRLLAVNASIEAVKAGEQGKGFAVVAAEVQSLADQSKESTERVRSILDDIQRATSEAVMKTEQGTRAVETGVEQAGHSGEAIRKLAESVDQAAQATTQISVSSQEQLVGMDQVVSAMESIKIASSQNVTATRQVESAAQDLYKLGQRLSEFMEQYTLNS